LFSLEGNVKLRKIEGGIGGFIVEKRRAVFHLPPAPNPFSLILVLLLLLLLLFN
jgi:hypothetical protein